MERQPCVYMLASKRNGTLYTGVTSNLLKRVWEHKNNLVEGFTNKYGVHTLVWYELHKYDGFSNPTRKSDQKLETSLETEGD